MGAMKIAATVNENGMGMFEINGQPFPVCSATIEVKAGEPTRVRLELPPVPVEVSAETPFVTIERKAVADSEVSL